MIGTAVAFYLGFKNNQAYDRLWEALKVPRPAKRRRGSDRFLDEIISRARAGGKRVAFLHPKSTFGVLTEFCEPQ